MGNISYQKKNSEATKSRGFVRGTQYKILLIIAIVFIASSKLFSADISYLKGMPNPERILNEVKGKDPIDTYARQAAALNSVRKVVNIHGMFRTFGPEEQKVINNFYRVSGAAYKNAEKIIGAKKMTESHKLVSKYEQDQDFIENVFKKYLSPETKKYHERTVKEYNERVEKQVAIAKKKRAFEQIISLLTSKLSIGIMIILGAMRYANFDARLIVKIS